MKITISQRLPHRSESSEPHVRFPSPGVWQLEEEPQSVGCWLAGQVCKSSTGVGETETPGGYTQFPCALGPRLNQGLHRVWVRPTCRSWRASRESKAVAHRGGRTLEAEVLEIFISVHSSGGCHFGKTWPHPSANNLKSS